MPAIWQPRPEAESLHIILLTHSCGKRIGESTADDSHGWILAEFVYNWWRHEIPRYTDITVFLRRYIVVGHFLVPNTAHPITMVIRNHICICNAVCCSNIRRTCTCNFVVWYCCATKWRGKNRKCDTGLNKKTLWNACWLYHRTIRQVWRCDRHVERMTVTLEALPPINQAERFCRLYILVARM